MIKKTLFAIFCLSINCLYAFEDEILLDKGKYQMKIIPKDYGISHVYLLDTEKGTIWKSIDNGKSLGEWIQFPPLPLEK